MSLLTHVISVTSDIASYINVAFVLIETIFHLLTSLGAILIQSLTFIYSGFFRFLLGVIDGTGILLRDFLLFIEDINQLSDETIHAANQSVSFFTQLTSSFYCNIYKVVGSTIETLLNVAQSTVLTVKQLIILIGDSTLLILQLVPFTIVSGVSWVYQNIVWIFRSLKSLGINSIIRSRASCVSFYHELTDIPLSSLIGLVLALIIGLLLKRYMKLFNFSRSLKIMKDWVTKWCLQKWKATRPTQSVDSSFDQPQCSNADTYSKKSKSALLKELEREREGKLCVICQDNLKCFILLPCRHFCLCQICMQILAESNPVCPICRHYVYDNLKIYNWSHSKYIWFSLSRSLLCHKIFFLVIPP